MRDVRESGGGDDGVLMAKGDGFKVAERSLFVQVCLPATKRN